jgi:hypothetical protein
MSKIAQNVFLMGMAFNCFVMPAKEDASLIICQIRLNLPNNEFLPKQKYINRLHIYLWMEWPTLLIGIILGFLGHKTVEHMMFKKAARAILIMITLLILFLAISSFFADNSLMAGNKLIITGAAIANGLKNLIFSNSVSGLFNFRIY